MTVFTLTRIFVILALLNMADANLGVFNKTNVPNEGRIYGVAAKYYNEIPEISGASCVFISDNFSDYKICEMDLFVGESVIIQCEQFKDSNIVLHLRQNPLYLYKKYGKNLLNSQSDLITSSYIDSIKPDIKITEINKFDYTATLVQWTWDGTEPNKQYDLNFNCGIEDEDKKTINYVSTIKIRLMPSIENREHTNYLNLEETKNPGLKKLIRYYKHLTYGQDFKIVGGHYKLTGYSGNEEDYEYDILNNDSISTSKTKENPIKLNLNHKYVTITDKDVTVNLRDPKNIFGKDETNIVHIIIGESTLIANIKTYTNFIIYLYAPTYYSRLPVCGNIGDPFNITEGNITKIDKTCFINSNITDEIALHCDEGSSLVPYEDWTIMDGYNENIPLSDIIKIESIKKISPSLTLLSYSPLPDDLNKFKYMNNYDRYVRTVTSFCKSDKSPIDSEDSPSLQARFVFAKEAINDYENDPELIEINRYESFLYPGGYVEINCPITSGDNIKVGPIDNDKVYLDDNTSEEFKLRTEAISDIAIGLKRVPIDNGSKLIYSYDGKIKGGVPYFYLTCVNDEETNPDKFIGLTKIFLMDKPLNITNGEVDYTKIKQLNQGEISYWSLPYLNETDMKIDCSKFFNNSEGLKIDIYPNEWNTVILDRPGKKWTPDTAVTASFGHSFLSNGLIIGKDLENNNIINAQISDYATLISQHKIPFYYVCIATNATSTPETKADPSEDIASKTVIQEPDADVKVESDPEIPTETNYAMAVFEWVPNTIYKKIKGCGMDSKYFIDDYGENYNDRTCSFDVTDIDLHEDPIAFHCPTSLYKINPIKCYDRSNSVKSIFNSKIEMPIFGAPTSTNEPRSLWYVVKENIIKLNSSYKGSVTIQCNCYDETENIISSISITSNAH